MEEKQLDTYKHFFLRNGAVLAKPGSTAVTSMDGDEYVVTIDCCVASFRMTREQYDGFVNNGSVDLIP